MYQPRSRATGVYRQLSGAEIFSTVAAIIRNCEQELEENPMTTAVEEYKIWLNGQLRDFGDDDVFCSYIIGILEGDETVEEKKEALDSILSEAIKNDLDEFVESLLNKWNELQSADKVEDHKPAAPKLDVNEQLAKMLEAQTLQTSAKSRQYTEEERRIKQQILAQYSQTAVSDEEDEEDEDDVPDKPKAVGIEKNTNAQDVLQLQKERREQARMDSAAKKLKDREDREKQKKLREEKKEKRKTVKGERRR